MIEDGIVPELLGNKYGHRLHFWDMASRNHVQTVDLGERFFLEGEMFRGRRAHQVRLEGGDASSDSYCYSS